MLYENVSKVSTFIIPMRVNSSLGIKSKWYLCFSCSYYRFNQKFPVLCVTDPHPGPSVCQPLSETVSPALPREKRKQLVMSRSLMGEEALAIKAEKRWQHFTFSLH